jgi:hypothetical protein
MLKTMINMPLKGVLNQPRLKLAPATLAVFIQFVALVIVFCCVIGINHFFVVRFSLLSLVILQSVSAVALCMIAGMAVWWRWIHGVFPLAMYVMAIFSLPNEFYLIGFLVTLSVFWTTFRSQVPFFPSRPIVHEKVAGLLSQFQAARMIDIGSGLGDMSMTIAKQQKQCQVEGIEIAPMPWLISVIRAKWNRSSASFQLGNYEALDFGQYDLVFAYLSPAAMPDLWQKAQQDMHAGSLLVSYEFEIPNVSPAFTIEDAAHPTIYVWKM